MGTHTISIPDDSADAYSPLHGDFFSASNRIADKVLCPLGPSPLVLLSKKANRNSLYMLRLANGTARA